MSKVAVYTEKAPKPRPVYSQAIVANGFVFCSGQLPKTVEGKLVEGTVQDRCVRHASTP
jgi:enamine deaminase RidA (YjgF/YER057c/UK114 family)